MTIRKQTTLWTTKDKRRVRICDMVDDHLINTIKMLRRMAAFHLEQEIRTAYAVLGTLGGEMAIECCENDITMLEDMHPEEFLSIKYPIYDKLLLDAERRGLKI